MPAALPSSVANRRREPVRPGLFYSAAHRRHLLCPIHFPISAYSCNKLGKHVHNLSELLDLI